MRRLEILSPPILSDLYPALATELAGAGSDDALSTGDAVYRAACRIGPADSFAIARYLEDENTFVAVYRRAGDRYLPVGALPPLFPDGPVMTLSREGKPVLLHDGGEHRSALYLPITRAEPSGAERLLGLLAVSAKMPEAYPPCSVCQLQQLAEVAGQLLWEGAAGALLRSLREAQAGERVNRRRAVATAGRCADALHEIGERIQALGSDFAEAGTELCDALQNIHRECVQAATNVIQELIETGEADPGEAGEDRERLLATLTDREREVLQHLIAGESNAAIADKLCVTVETVKFHCHSIYHKLGVSSRLQAVRVATGMLASDHTSTKV